MMSLFLPQATEWASSEDTRRSCQSKGKTEVHAGGIGGSGGSLWSRKSWGILVSMRSLAPEAWGEGKGSQWRQELDLRAELISAGML